MRFFAYVLLAAVAAAGCGESGVSAIPPGADRDASVDPDGGMGGTGGAGGIADRDASVDPDGGMGGTGGAGGIGGGSWCETSALCPSCPDPEALCDASNPCPVGEVCLATGCEDLSRCFGIGGGACENDEDCGNSNYECDLTIGRCLRTEPGCDDSTDCVPGFACEDNTCVDRRVPCVTAVDCPHGYTCFFATADQRFCRRIARPCADDGDCLVLGVPCGDSDGDGSMECMPSLMPTVPNPISCDVSQCAEPTAPVCETSVAGVAAVCGRFGACSSSIQCADGFECRDLWGDRRQECVLPAGSCVDSSSCDPRMVCASSRAGGPPACVGSPSM